MMNYLIYATSTVFTYIFGKLSKKLNWNESLPIPIQNILVGMIVFAIYFIYIKITGGQLDAEALIQQIIFAIGGSGTATLAYDTSKLDKEEK